jgi:hypothetical protein
MGGIQSSLAVGISTTGDGTIAFEYGVQQDRKFKKERLCGVFARVHYRVAQKRKGEFSCEISPSQFRFSEIRFWSRITTLVSQNRLAPTSGARVFTSLFYDPTRCKSFPSAVRFQLPGSSLVADSRRRLLVHPLLLEDLSSSETNSTLSQRECQWLLQFCAVEMGLQKWKFQRRIQRTNTRYASHQFTCPS